MKTLKQIEDDVMAAWAADGSIPELDQIPEEYRDEIFELMLCLVREDILIDYACIEAFGDMDNS